MNINTIRLLSALKTAAGIKQETVKLQTNHLATSIIRSLYLAGYVLSYNLKRKENIMNETRIISVLVRYTNNKGSFNNLRFLSKPSNKQIISLKSLCRLNSKNTFFLFSTNLGLLSLKECKKKRLGGVALFSL